MRWTDEWVRTQGEQYLRDASFRRTTLMASLANPANSYSRQRIGSYGLETRGWDVLPVWNPRTGPVTKAMEGTARIELPRETLPLWNGVKPANDAEWIELGRRAFFEYPLRPEVFAEHALAEPGRLERFAIHATRDGVIPGLRAFADVDGRTRIGITCALCHTRVVDGVMTVGAARRDFDYGAFRLAYHRDTHTPVSAELAARMERWGPGRADVTEDDGEDPVAIPDLWGLRDQVALAQAGTLRHSSPVVLAIRQETQLLHSNHQRIRPPREVAWALAMYLYTLRAPPPLIAAPADRVRVERGRQLFARECASCHSNAAYGGPPVTARRVGTDPALAIGAARGTGLYRPPALIDVRNAAPYLHHGAIRTLEDLLSPARTRDDYRSGALGPGAVPGHEYGTGLADTERGALIAFLRTL